MAGILASMFAGAGAGGFKAMGENADDRIKEGIEGRKAAALEARQLNLIKISQQYQTGRDDLNYKRTTDRQAITDKAQQDRYAVEDTRWRTTNKQLQDRYAVEDTRWRTTNKQQKDRYAVEDSRWEKTNSRAQTSADQQTSKFNREESEEKIKRDAKVLYSRIENMGGQGDPRAMLANADPEVASIVRSAIAAKKAGNEEKYWDQLEKQTNIMSKQADIGKTKAETGRFGQPDMNKINQKAAEMAQKAKDSFLTTNIDPVEAQKVYDQAYADYRSAAAGGGPSNKGSRTITELKEEFDKMGNTAKTGGGLLSGSKVSNSQQPIDQMSVDEIKNSYGGDQFGGEVGTTPWTAVQKLAGSSQSRKYEKFGEGKIEMTLRQLGIETDLQKQKAIADVLRSKYSDASEDQIVMMIRQSVKKGL